MFYRFSKVTGKACNHLYPNVFVMLYFGLGSRRDMNIAACAMVFLLECLGAHLYKITGLIFWGKPRKYFWFRDCRNFLSDNALSIWCKGCCYQNDGLAPIRGLINVHQSGLTSPFCG